MQLLEPQIISGGSFEAIEIGVIQRQAPASILVNERECRAADLLWIETESSRQPPHKRGLPRSEISRQQQHIARHEATSQLVGHGGRLGF